MTVDSGSDVRSITLSVEQWSAIVLGVEILLEGERYPSLGYFEQEFWRFNEEVGQLVIYSSLLRDIYSGGWAGSAVNVELALE
jgi:hypothetical protein